MVAEFLQRASTSTADGAVALHGSNSLFSCMSVWSSNVHKQVMIAKTPLIKS